MTAQHEENMNQKDIAINEAAEIIKILLECKPKTIEKHMYTDDRILNWWKKHGRGEIELIIRKKFTE